MTEFIFAPQNILFVVAILVMLTIALIEGVGAMLGAGLSGFLDDLIPGTDLEFEGPDLEAPGALARCLSWMRIGKVPVLVLLVVFLLTFGVAGLMIQDLVQSITGALLPGLVAVVVSFTVSLPIVRMTVEGLTQLIPSDETTAVHRQTLIGRTATITLGEAKAGYPTQAKVRDQYGKTHYLMVEPDTADGTFSQGEEVLLVKYDGVRFYGIRPVPPTAE